MFRHRSPQRFSSNRQSGGHGRAVFPPGTVVQAMMTRGQLEEAFVSTGTDMSKGMPSYIDALARLLQRYHAVPGVEDDQDIQERFSLLYDLKRMVFHWFNENPIAHRRIKEDIPEMRTHNLVFKLMGEIQEEHAKLMVVIINKKKPLWVPDQTPGGGPADPETQALWTELTGASPTLGISERGGGDYDGFVYMGFRSRTYSALARLMEGERGRALVRAMMKAEKNPTMLYPTASPDYFKNAKYKNATRRTREMDNLGLKSGPEPMRLYGLNYDCKDTAFLRYDTSWSEQIQVATKEAYRPRPKSTKATTAAGLELGVYKQSDAVEEEEIDQWLDIESTPEVQTTEGGYTPSPYFLNLADMFYHDLSENKSFLEEMPVLPSHAYEEDPDLKHWGNRKNHSVGLRMNLLREEQGLAPSKWFSKLNNRLTGKVGRQPVRS
ncbi:hypothetical protein [Fulvitalea axinellae]